MNFLNRYTNFWLICIALFSLFGFASEMQASPQIDTLILGDAISEKEHELKFDRSEVIRGGLDEPARQLLPLEPNSFKGGTITFRLKVDSEKQNYITVKFWGSDKGAGRGRFILFSGNQQLGYRSEGDLDVLNTCEEEGECPSRFFYQTLPLPPALTNRKETIELTIASFGPVWFYGENFARFQKNLTMPTRGIYRIYTHTTTRFVPPPGEKQGEFLSRGVRTAPGEEVIEKSRQIVIKRINDLLGKPQSENSANARSARDTRLELLAQAFNTSWTPAYKNPKAIEQIILDADNSVKSAAADPKYFDNAWSGLGPMGKAITKIWPAIEKRMDEIVDLGVEGAVTRRQAYAKMLRLSVDRWRTQRRSYTNQCMIVDLGIYSANRGLRLLEPTLALPESQAIRYLYEAVGLETYMGNDQSGNTSSVADTPELGKTMPYGSRYRLVTTKGLSRELGWVGTYGETILCFANEMIDLTGDSKIREQLRTIQKARFYFRYPGLDVDGYSCMKLPSEVDTRTAHYPLAGAAYNASNIRESWWLDVAATLSDDPMIAGVAQQCLADGQYFAYIDRRLGDPQTLGMMRNVDEYEKVKNLPKSDDRLPMTDGQPDFVFSDEENAIVVVKHRDTKLFVNLYFRAENAVNRISRLLEISPVMYRISTVRPEVKVANVVGTFKRPDYIHSMRSRSANHLPPSPVPAQAWAGEEMPIAGLPDDAKPVAAGQWGPLMGLASYYELRYGDYLIAVNTTEDQSYDVIVPAEATNEAVDLVTKSAVSAGQKCTLGPRSTLVIYLAH